MIDVQTDTPAYLVAFRLSGRIEADDVEHAIGGLQDAFDRNEEVNIFVEIESLESMGPKAFLKDVQMGLGQIKNIRRMHRVAVVADQEWIRTAAEWEGRLFSSIDLRVFEPSEREEALRWASEAPPRAGEGLARGLEEIATQDPATLAFAFVGPVTGADVEAITPKLSAAYDQHGTVNLLMRMDAGYRFRLDVFSEQLTELKTGALGHVERYAVVGAPDWMRAAGGLFAPLLKTEMRFFEGAAAAWDWLGTEPAAEHSAAGRLDTPPSA